jgi:hypothetical protein
MAQKIWAGSDGNYDTAGNWSPANKPSLTTEDVIVPASSVQAIISNADNENAVDLNSIYIQRGHNEDVATSGAPWKISTDLLVHEGGGTLYFHAGDIAAVYAVDETIINATPATSAKQSASLTGDAGVAEYQNMNIVRGMVTIEGVTFTIDQLIIGSAGQSPSEVDVTLQPADGLIIAMYVHSGVVRLSRPVTTLVITGGRVIIDDFEPTTVIQSGGQVEYRTPTAAGTVTTWNLSGGSLDLSRSFLPLSITTLNLSGDARWLPGQYSDVTTINDYRIAG